MKPIADFLSELFAQRSKPVVIERGQQVVFVKLCRGCERSYFARTVVCSSASAAFASAASSSTTSDVHKDPAANVTEKYRLPAGYSSPVAPVSNCAAAAVNSSAPEIRGIPANSEGQLLTRLRYIAVQDQLCEQGLEAVCVYGCDRLTRDIDMQVAEQIDPHNCRFC